MSHSKQDKALVASKQNYEVQHIAKKYGIPASKVREVIAELKAEGRGYRSRRVIYERLRNKGYSIPYRKKKIS